MKQHIIFSVNQLTRIKTNLCLSYKTNMENIQDSFSKYFILSKRLLNNQTLTVTSFWKSVIDINMVNV